MTKIITVNKSSEVEQKLLTDFRAFRAAMRERVDIYQRLPEGKKKLWLEKDDLMREFIDYASLLYRGKDDN